YHTTYGELRTQLANYVPFDVDSLVIWMGQPPVALEYPAGTMIINTAFTSDAELFVSERERHWVPMKESTASHGGSAPNAYCNKCGSTNIGYGSHPAHSEPKEEHKEPSALSLPHHNSSIPSVPVKNSGYLIERKVPGDNSCLFQCLVKCLGLANLTVEDLRATVCQMINDDPYTYNEAVLETTPQEYCRWILQPTSWGGGIEMALISSRFHVEICSIDMSTLRVDRFGEGRYFRRVVLLYSGSHYNYAALAASPGDPAEFDQTMFEIGVGMDVDSSFLTVAVELARLLR
ncbi:ubiquitin-specific protease otu1, partial [Kickxella alabastrina]